MHRRTATLLTLVILPALARPVLADGIVIELTETSGGQATRSTLHLDAGHVRADVQDDGQAVTMIYDAAADTMRIIQPGQGTWSEITRADLDGMRAAMGGVGGAAAGVPAGPAGGAMAGMQAQLAQVQAQLASLPPEQRAMVEQMMKGANPAGMAGVPGAPAAAADPDTWQQSGNAQVGAWPCTVWTGSSGGQPVSEVCATTAALPVSAADFAIVRQLAEFVHVMAPQDGDDDLVVWGDAARDGWSGFPVRQVRLAGGQVESVTEVTGLRREALPASLWAVPAGLRRQDLGAM